ncbi:hypothetical protein Tco_1398197 [Tanacetum coccineum]
MKLGLQTLRAKTLVVASSSFLLWIGSSKLNVMLGNDARDLPTSVLAAWIMCISLFGCMVLPSEVAKTSAWDFIRAVKVSRGTLWLSTCRTAGLVRCLYLILRGRSLYVACCFVSQRGSRRWFSLFASSVRMKLLVCVNKSSSDVGSLCEQAEPNRHPGRKPLMNAPDTITSDRSAMCKDFCMGLLEPSLLQNVCPKLVPQLVEAIHASGCKVVLPESRCSA